MTDRIALVGVPCDIEAIRKAQALARDINQDWPNKVALTIGLFCRENWAYTCFRALVQDDYGVKLGEVEKFDIKKGKIIAYGREGVKAEIPLPDSKVYVRVGCQVCVDFSALSADISVGAVGTPADCSTIIVRTDKGLKLVEGAIKEGYIAAKPIEEVKPGTAIIKKIAKEKLDESLAEAREREASAIQVTHLKTADMDMDAVKAGAKGKGFKELSYDVIDPGLCSVCGNCATACPEIRIENERPTLKEGSTGEGCEAAYLLCPRATLPLKALERSIFPNGTAHEEGIGRYIKIIAAKARPEKAPKRQDGGAVTALLAYALDKGIIDGALTVKAGGEPWKPVPKVSRRSEELYETGGTIYSHVTIIPALRGA